MSGFEENLRIAVGTAVVQSGFLDQDDDTPGTEVVELLDWHPCYTDGCTGVKCFGCSGVPYLSDAVWSKIDKFGYLAKALQAIEAAQRPHVVPQVLYDKAIELRDEARDEVRVLEERIQKVREMCAAASQPCTFNQTGVCTHEGSRLDPAEVLAVLDGAGDDGTYDDLPDLGREVGTVEIVLDELPQLATGGIVGPSKLYQPGGYGCVIHPSAKTEEKP